MGLVDLLSNNGKSPDRKLFATNGLVENCTADDSVIQCLIGFVAGTGISSIKRATDDNISGWYYSVSNV
jgi:hypothetical protein